MVKCCHSPPHCPHAEAGHFDCRSCSSSAIKRAFCSPQLLNNFDFQSPLQAIMLLFSQTVHWTLHVTFVRHSTFSLFGPRTHPHHPHYTQKDCSEASQSMPLVPTIALHNLCQSGCCLWAAPRQTPWQLRHTLCEPFQSGMGWLFEAHY